MARGKNDLAWEQIFEKYKIIDAVQKDGHFVINAEQIKEFREPRLMTKFDSKIDLPIIFNENKLAILPTKRGEYVIGKFYNYQEIEIDNSIDVETMYLPDFVTTINSKNITSEAISLSSAFISGMLEDLVGEEVIPTIQGRMGTGKFKYKIKTDTNNDFWIDVENSQMEIDGSYEGLTKFVIVEAKNHYMSDFIIRQLFYPYRVWKNITNKEILPIMLIKHDNIFNFYVYKFDDDDNYNSIKLYKIKRYILGEVYQQIELDDIYEIMNNVKMVDESPDVPFPQADSFYRVLDFINILNDSEMKINEIAELYEFDDRQGSYYSAAGKYLGFVESDRGGYKLTEYGKSIMKMDHKSKNLEIVKAILSHKPFYKALEQYLNNGYIDNKNIAEIILEISPNVNSPETAKRRAQSVSSWVRWIINLTATYEQNPFDRNNMFGEMNDE